MTAVEVVEGRPSPYGQALNGANEGSPLLSKSGSHVSRGFVQTITEVDEYTEEKPSPESLIWIMYSIWVGVFCAGLGESKAIPDI